MNNFISFSIPKENFDYLFNKNHYLLLLCSLVIIIFFAMYFSRQKHRVQKISSIVCGFLLLALEGLRIFWRYKFLQHNNQSLDFFNIVQLDFFTTSLWISIPLILIFSILKRKGKPASKTLNFVFGVAGLFAVISLIYPININSNFEFWHCYNLIYAITRSIICMLALMYVFTKWISVSNFLDMWKSLLSLLFFGITCFCLGSFANTNSNMFFVNEFPLFNSIGMYLPSPWHIVMLGAFLFVFQIILHLPFLIRQHIKNRHV
ncbi:MAG: hypothetical protein IJD48_01860 [Clostridia bacterium]|nr:hypothetical protein [Clostridia bacterium]